MVSKPVGKLKIAKLMENYKLFGSPNPYTDVHFHFPVGDHRLKCTTSWRLMEQILPCGDASLKVKGSKMSGENAIYVLTQKLISEQKTLRGELQNLRLKVEALKRNHEKELRKMQHLMQDVPYYYSGHLLNPQKQGPATSSSAINTEASGHALLSKSADMISCGPLRPIGHVKSAFKKKNATPRQASICADSTSARLTLERRSADGGGTALSNPSHAIDGLGEFSHIWLIFVFHQNGDKSSTRAKVAPPRLDGRRVGVFGTRSPHRPNPIGLSLVRLDSIEGDTLYLSGVDLLDGTPVLDIKPYIPQYDNPNLCRVIERPLPSSSSPPPPSPSSAVECRPTSVDEVRVPAWIADPPVKKLTVRFTTTASKQLDDACRLESQSSSSSNAVRRSLENILGEDTRSVYRRNRCQDRLYFFVFGFLHVTSWFDDDYGVVEVLRVRHRVDADGDDDDAVEKRNKRLQ